MTETRSGRRGVRRAFPQTAFIISQPPALPTLPQVATPISSRELSDSLFAEMAEEMMSFQALGEEMWREDVFEGMELSGLAVALVGAGTLTCLHLEDRKKTNLAQKA